MEKIENRLLLDVREGLQTPGDIPRGSGMERYSDPQYLPPCNIEHTALLRAVSNLVNNTDTSIELPNPLSSPSISKRNRELLAHAYQLGVTERVPMHVRMAEIDLRQAIACGAEVIHLFGNSSYRNGNQNRTIAYWLNQLQEIAQIGDEVSMKRIRASLEHATETAEEDLLQFVLGIQKINAGFERPVITDIGFPDTNGSAIPEDYENLFTLVGEHLKKAGLILHVHLHDDNGLALQNLKMITAQAKKREIPLSIEVAHPLYPGERVGIQPTYINFPDVFSGSSWRDSRVPDADKFVRHIHVAGVHTHNMNGYSNGNGALPAYGLYSIMGKGNIAFWQENVLGMSVSGREVLAAAALIGREYAAQHGSQRHAYALALARLAHEDPELLIETAESFGEPLVWLSKPIPDLQFIKNKLDELILTDRFYSIKKF